MSLENNKKEALKKSLLVISILIAITLGIVFTPEVCLAQNLFEECTTLADQWQGVLAAVTALMIAAVMTAGFEDKQARKAALIFITAFTFLCIQAAASTYGNGFFLLMFPIIATYAFITYVKSLFGGRTVSGGGKSETPREPAPPGKKMGGLSVSHWLRIILSAATFMALTYFVSWELGLGAALAVYILSWIAMGWAKAAMITGIVAVVAIVAIAGLGFYFLGGALQNMQNPFSGIVQRVTSGAVTPEIVEATIGGILYQKITNDDQARDQAEVLKNAYAQTTDAQIKAGLKKRYDEIYKQYPQVFRQ